jgi:bifunctional DNA-binding transcriptional regulator/antitoxin component of YhaV-PrlF toxin-antitoxin module
MNARISRGGQISIPAEIRRRWATTRVPIEDKGDAVVVRPLPQDPIAAARGRFTLPPGVTLEDMRVAARQEEARIEAQRTAGL